MSCSRLSLLCTFIFLITFTFSEARVPKKHPSAVVVGTVYCDTCFHQDFSKFSHFISGASVAVECGDNARPSFREGAKTNEHGEFQVHLPFSVSKHAKKIKRCSVKLINSSDPYCAVASSATSSSIHLKSGKHGTHIFSAGFFTFKPLKQPELCDEKRKEPRDSMKKTLSISDPNDPNFLPPIQDPPTSVLPPVDQNYLPPLPELPTLPSLPPLPPLPTLSGLPSNPPGPADEKVAEPDFFNPIWPPNPLLPPPTLFPPITNPFQPPPSILPPVFPSPPPSIFPPIFPSPPPTFFPPIFPPGTNPPSFPLPPLIPGLTPSPPSPPPSIFPPIFPSPPPTFFPPIFPPSTNPPSFPFPPLIPGLTPSPPPPPPYLPIPFPPFPFQPTPGYPGVPPATPSFP